MPTKILSLDLLETNCSLEFEASSRSESLRKSNGLNIKLAKKSTIAALEYITPRQKEIILLYINGHNMVEIADLLSINVSTVSRTYHRGIDKLKKYLRIVEPFLTRIDDE